MPQGPPPHRSLLSVRSHSRGARVPSGVFASLQGLLWPDFFFLVVPTIPLEAQRGRCLQGGPRGLLKLKGFTKKPCLSWERLRENRLRRQHDPRAAFLWRRQGTFRGTHPSMHPVQASITSHPSRTAPPAPGTTPQPGTHRAPMRSATPSFHKHTGVHTHNVAHTQGRNGESLGCEAGRLLCCSCPRSGKVRPLLWERPCEMMAGVGIPGAQPQGNNLPGHLALLVPSRQCLPPSPRAAPKGWVGQTIAQRGKGG